MVFLVNFIISLAKNEQRKKRTEIYNDQTKIQITNYECRKPNKNKKNEKTDNVNHLVIFRTMSKFPSKLMLWLIIFIITLIVFNYIIKHGDKTASILHFRTNADTSQWWLAFVSIGKIGREMQHSDVIHINETETGKEREKECV